MASSLARGIVFVSAVLGLGLAGCDRPASDQASGAGTRPGSIAGENASGGSGGRPGAAASGGAPGTTDSTPVFSTDSAGSSGASSSSSGGAALDDSIISTKVKTALLADKDIKAGDISVEARQGEILLSGAVQNQAQIDKAVKVAGAVDGVRHVQNRMTVKR